MTPTSPGRPGNPGGGAGAGAGRPVVPRTPFCLRLTFAYDLRHPDAGLRLSRVERVRATAPGIATQPPHAGQSGAWFEVRDAAGAFLYYQPLHDPMPTSVEVFADKAGQPALGRLPRKQPNGEFQVLIPDLPAAHTFALHASDVGKAATPAPAAGKGPQPARALLQIGFDEIRKHISTSP